MSVNKRKFEKKDFISLYVPNEPMIRAFVLSLVHNFTDADEIMQQVSITLWQKCEQLDSTDNFMKWALTVAKFTTYSYIRSQKRLQTVPLNEKLAEMLVDEMHQETETMSRQRIALEECVKGVNNNSMKLLRMYYTGASIKELSQKAKRTAASLYKLFYRIRSSLYGCITIKIRQGDV